MKKLFLSLCLILLAVLPASSVPLPLLLGGGTCILWNPINGANLNAWWDAQNTSKFILSGSNVTSWTDSSPNAVVASGVANPVYTTNIINGNSVVAFNGNSQYLTTTLSSSTAPFTSVAIIKVDNSGFVRTILGASVNGGFEFRVNTSNTLSLNLQQTAAIGTSSGTITTSAAAVVSVSYDGTNYSFTINGTIVGSGTNAQTPTASTVRIGANTPGATFFYHYMGDIVQFGAVNTSELNKTIGYLAWKYGLQGNLPAGFPYQLRPPCTSDV